MKKSTDKIYLKKRYKTKMEVAIFKLQKKIALQIKLRLLFSNLKNSIFLE